MFIYFNNSTVDLKGVPKFDLNKYVGLWYEIARLDSPLEYGKIKVSMDYILKEDGTLKVVHTGWRDGILHRAIGHGILADPEELWHLKIAFFLNFYTPYHILNMDEDYSYALVAGRNEKYLWILSRTPKLHSGTLNSLISEANDRGFNTSELVFVKQG